MNFYVIETDINDKREGAQNIMSKEEKAAQLRMLERAKRKNLRKKVEVSNFEVQAFYIWKHLLFIIGFRRDLFN